MNGQSLYKLLSGSPRLPKPWEDTYQNAQRFIAWADAIPESTPRSLLPMVWAVKDRLTYQDGGGLNGFLKEHGLTKKGWKALNQLSIEHVVGMYRYFASRGETAWPARLAKPIDAIRESAIEPSPALLITLADADISLEGVNPPYDEDWKLMIKALATELSDKDLSVCAQAAADAILVRDYINGGDVDITRSTTWPEMTAMARRYIEEMSLDIEDPEEQDVIEAPQNLNRVVPTPGGQDFLVDANTGLEVVRLLTHQDFIDESDQMGHCIGRWNGKIQHGYFNKHVNGEGAFYSFRRPGERRPIATLELGCLDGDWRVCQVRGPSNRDPGPDANDLAARLREAHQVGGCMKESTIEFINPIANQNYSLERTYSRYF